MRQNQAAALGRTHGMNGCGVLAGARGCGGGAVRPAAAAMSVSRRAQPTLQAAAAKLHDCHPLVAVRGIAGTPALLLMGA